jgi:hypothetical protein
MAVRLMRRRWDLFWLAIALVPLAWLFWRNTMLASRMIDGTRYFLLDDDMMISMRYGRNLAEGHGLVWNPGERVEGYTNFAWTLVMAALHFLPVAAARMALLVKGVNFMLTSGTLYLSLRLLRRFSNSYLATPLLLVVLVTCADVLLWSVWGFEVALVTFLNLFFILRMAEGRHDVWAFGAIALLPLTRGDGIYLFAANGAIALLLSEHPRRTLRNLALALLPAIAHLAFRRAYYGDWLPNTYYLKMYGLDLPFKRGSAYTRNFLLQYSVVLAAAGATAVAILRTDQRGVLLYGSVLPAILWATFVGGDMFVWYRFLAHLLPIILVFAVTGISVLVRGAAGRGGWAAVIFLSIFPIGNPLERLIFLDTNGDPLEQIQVAGLLLKNARPDSSIAVITAGIVPYFTRMKAIDILGKGDRHIARLKPFPGAMVGHGKLDPRYTLGRHPDLVISCRSHDFAVPLQADTRTPDPVLSFLASSAFQTNYLPNPIEESFTLGRTAIYTYSGSQEAKNPVWKGIAVLP